MEPNMTKRELKTEDWGLPSVTLWYFTVYLGPDLGAAGWKVKVEEDREVVNRRIPPYPPVRLAAACPGGRGRAGAGGRARVIPESGVFR